MIDPLSVYIFFGDIYIVIWVIFIEGNKFALFPYKLLSHTPFWKFLGAALIIILLWPIFLIISIIKYIKK